MKKYIEIDGVKYIIDPNDETKALLNDKGEKTLYVEETPPVDPPANPPKDPLTIESLEELAKTNPEVARILKEKKEADELLKKQEEEKDEERKEQLRKNGEFQKLSEEAEEKRKKAELKEKEASFTLEKYKATVVTLRDAMIEQISEDKRQLIPNDNPRNQIDYIQKNAKFLGVSVINKGNNVPPNKDNPPLDEEGKLQKEFKELLDKQELTITEKNRMSEVSRLLKDITARKV